MKKIVHAIFSLTTGGSENLLIDLVNRQVASAEVHIIIINDHYSQKLVDQIDKRVHKHMIERKQGSKNIFKIYKVNSLFAKIKPDVIHCHNHDLINLVFRFRSRTVLTVHALTENVNDIKKYRKIVAISQAVKEDVEKRSDIPLSVDVVYNAIDFDKIPVKESFARKDKIRIVQVGRLMHEVKGQDILLEAIRILVEDRNRKDIQLDIVGDGDSKDYLDKIIERNKLAAYVSIFGNKDRTWLYPNLKNYDILIQPSRIEGFGLTVIEGIAAKLPLITSNIDGPKEILGHGKYGELFESENPVDLADKIDLVIRNYEQGRIEGKVNRSYVYAKSSFSMNKMLADYNKVYQSMMPTPAVV